MKRKPLPAQFLARVAPDDRKKIRRQLLDGNEASLQSEIAKLLDERGIVFQKMRMDMPTTGTAGWPDFAFCVQSEVRQWNGNHSHWRDVPILWECKIGKAKLSEEQEKLRPGLERNGWQYRVIRTIEEARAHLEELK